MPKIATALMLARLGQHLFSVSVAASMGAVAIFNAAKHRMEMETGTIPLQQRGDNN